MNRKCTKDDLQLANKYMKRCSDIRKNANQNYHVILLILTRID